jgi:hypothetical protein
MSQVGLPAEDKENSSKTDGREQQIKHDWRDYFRCRPVAYAQILLPEITGPECRKQQDGYSSGALRVARNIIHNRPIASIAFAIVAVALTLLLIRAGVFRPDNITLFAGVATAFFACMQWRIYTQQCAVMRDQHETMEKQMGQTDQIIKYMRDERRPWVAIVDPKVVELDEGSEVRLFYRLVNSGPTPATIIGFTPDTCLIADIKHPELGDLLADRAPEPIESVTIVPPEGGCDQNFAQAFLSAAEYQRIVRGERWLAFVGVILYRGGVGGEVYETGFAFACQSNEQLRVIGSEKQNYMK